MTANRRYRIDISSEATRRLMRPHKWRGAGRSNRHCRAVQRWIGAMEAALNTADVYEAVDRELDEYLKKTCGY
jgi:hypothetical protein